MDVHANKQMYTLSELFSFEDFPSRMYNRPMKSNPVWVNGGSRDTLPLVNLESVVVCMELLLLFYRWHTFFKNLLFDFSTSWYPESHSNSG